jgi:hypothetical protein
MEEKMKVMTTVKAGAQGQEPVFIGTTEPIILRDVVYMGETEPIRIQL